MSIYGSLFSGVTALTAQSRALGTISENIANVNTVGFKAKTTQFSTLVAAGKSNSGSVGGVIHTTSAKIDKQGILQTTETDTDIAINGSGFFVVNDDVVNGVAQGDTIFTRAGHFAIDKDNNLANASGHYLMGWKLNKDGDFVNASNDVIVPDPTNEEDLLAVNLNDVTFTSAGTEEVSIKASFPTKQAMGDVFDVSSRVFDDLGGTHNLGFEFSKADHLELTGVLAPEPGGGPAPASFTMSTIALQSPIAELGNLTSSTSIDLTFDHTLTDATGTTWTVTATANNGTVDAATTTFEVFFNAEGEMASPAIQQLNIAWDPTLNAADTLVALDFSGMVLTAGGTPAATGTVNENGLAMLLETSTGNPNDAFIGASSTFVRFDQGGNLLSPSSLDLVVNWDNADTLAVNSAISFDLGRVGTSSGLSVGGNDFVLSSTQQDGFAFGSFEGVTIDNEGFVIANFKNGTFLPIYQLPIADFNNPNGLNAPNGNDFQATLESGNFFLNQAGKGGAGEIIPRSLEQSTVDIAREFTNMIVTQRAFSSASTVITTADEMLQELVQIKR